MRCWFKPVLCSRKRKDLEEWKRKRKRGDEKNSRLEWEMGRWNFSIRVTAERWGNMHTHSHSVTHTRLSVVWVGNMIPVKSQVIHYKVHSAPWVCVYRVCVFSQPQTTRVCLTQDERKAMSTSCLLILLRLALTFSLNTFLASNVCSARLSSA